MTYNEKFHKEISLRLNPRLNKLNNGQVLICKFLRDYLKSANGRNQTENYNCFLELLSRIRFNLNSITYLFPKLLMDYRFKNSINLLYRCIVDDLIQIKYLLRFIKIDSQLQTALGKELLILKRDYCEAMLKAQESNFQFGNALNTLHGHKKIEKVESNLDIVKNNPDISSNGVKLTNDKIRMPEDPEFKKFYVLTKPGKIISATQKLNVIKEGAEQNSLDNLETTYKYFSQFEHYSPYSYLEANNHAQLDDGLYKFVMEDLLLIMDYLINILNLKPVDLGRRCSELYNHFYMINTVDEDYPIPE